MAGRNEKGDHDATHSGWVINSPQNVDETVSALTSRQTSPKDRCDVRMVDPRLEDDGSDGVDDDDDILVVPSDGLDEGI